MTNIPWVDLIIIIIIFLKIPLTPPLVWSSCLRQFLLKPSGWLPSIWLIAVKLSTSYCFPVWNGILFPQFIWVCCLLVHYAWNLIHLGCKKLGDQTFFFFYHCIMFYLLSIIQFQWNEIVIMLLVLLQNFLITVHFVSLIYFISLFTVVGDNPELLH